MSPVLKSVPLLAVLAVLPAFAQPATSSAPAAPPQSSAQGDLPVACQTMGGHMMANRQMMANGRMMHGGAMGMGSNPNPQSGQPGQGMMGGWRGRSGTMMSGRGVHCMAGQTTAPTTKPGDQKAPQ